ncbi:aminopeptidase [Staphylococcus chromogenes]|uniref:AbrB family transcriptional regulator n=1 Tax=Staphylococcus chromogenes TaxID=46126 RepID=UPI000D1AA6A1|nr:AbrB family transcriptional regulator [Staphylococcus chromogenes]MCE4965983.1 AbrB family transcriptional regulator [Staphylococcus chromogenes]PTF74282.1 aminopeptidase [Staphylococcus chromogenes]PTG51317.1 aminopeptidase [Staphylococcus chromogenes]RIM08873.1 AbrB family transcriptional regulator [Staphylococcus chromogenes]
MSHLLRNNIILFALTLVCSFVLYSLHIMLPWMFGPIIASIIVVRVFKLEVKWPWILSELGLILLGVQIGSGFTVSVLNDIKNEWFSIILVTILLLGLALLVSIGFRRIAHVNTETALLSVIPGALSQMLVMAEENKKADILIVSLTQTSRIIFVVILVPLISLVFRQDTNSTLQVHQNLTEILKLQDIIILIIGIALIYFLMAFIHFPTKMLLAPIVVLIIWNLITQRTFTLDYPIIAVAQMIYMIRVGIQIAHLIERMKGRIALAIAFQNILLILGTFLMVLCLHFINKASINELFLSAAPGGMSQIVLVALETGGDVAMISSYHIFRIFFILFIIAPLIAYYLKFRERRQQRFEKLQK